MKTYPYDDEAQVENQTKTEPLNEQQRDLAAKHMPLAMALARKFSKHWDWLYDEMESVAMLALVEAAKSYDSSFNVRFSTYAKTGIFGALTNARNKLMQLHRNFASDGTDTNQWTSVRTSSSLSNEEFEEYLHKLEPDPSCFSMEHSIEFREELEHHFKRLPTRHRQFMEAVYFDQRPLEELARHLRCKPRRLEVIHREAINMLLSGDHLPMPRKSRRPKAFKRAVDPGFSIKTVPKRCTDLD